MKNVRRRALEALLAITEDGAYANLALKEAARGLSPEDARFLFALVYGVLDHLLYIDHVLSAFTKPHKNKTIRAILQLGAGELLYLHTPPHAVISQTVNLTKAVGKSALSSYVNGVLRALDRGRDALPPLPEQTNLRLSIQYSFPLWLVDRWIADYGAAFTESLLSAAPAGLCLRAQYPAVREAVIEELPCPIQRGRWDENALYPEESLAPAALPAFTEGRLTVQGEGAMLICRAMGDLKGKRVLDACAAPGGKSAYLYTLAEGDISLTCTEKHPHRVELMEKTFARLGVKGEIRVQDAAEPCPEFEKLFDAVLLDVPCSGLGLLLEKPDVRYAKTGDDIAALATLQARILNNACAWVRPGGLLLYATCTISKTENENQVTAFLKEHPEFALEPLPLPLENDGMVQLFPHIHQTDGFFMAGMRRCI